MQRTENAVNQADIVLILVDPQEGLIAIHKSS